MCRLGSRAENDGAPGVPARRLSYASAVSGWTGCAKFGFLSGHRFSDTASSSKSESPLGAGLRQSQSRSLKPNPLHRIAVCLKAYPDTNCALFRPAVQSRPSQRLLCNHAAGDAVAGIARGVGLLVVSLGVHHDCGASVAVQGMSVAAERDVFIHSTEMCLAVRANREVGNVPCRPRQP